MKPLFAIPDSARVALHRRFASRIEINPVLSRALVSYQSNRRRSSYRWFKYKEGFSASLVEYLLSHFAVESGTLLDPFAGTGAALFVARDHGIPSIGIELLPVGIHAIEARLAAEQVDRREFAAMARRIATGAWRVSADASLTFQHLRITEQAFPTATEHALAQYRTFLRDHVNNEMVRKLLDFACLSVLEAISYTRKDGQYLRWDSRAPRKLPGKSFDKGPILEFETALLARLREMSEDLHEPLLFANINRSNEPAIELRAGSCLHILPSLGTESCNTLVTSPPYCNRYDYTRTYALELAYLGVDEIGLKALRQALLSCTVENHSKIEMLRNLYSSQGTLDTFDCALREFQNQDALQEVLQTLDRKAARGELNNINVARMVRNYFLESTVAIFEWARIMLPGSRVAIVNDNVQYGGEEVPVDLVLSDLAEKAGFSTEKIWMLGRGKGNSSQQMGAHGRNELRKCVYVWRRD